MGKKLWLRAALAALATIIIAGCSGLGFPTPEPVELRFVYIDRGADYAALAEAFHREHPNITVTLDAVSPQGNLSSAMVQRIANADALRIPMEAISADLARAFLPLDGMTGTVSSLPREDLFAGSLEGLVVNGKQMGLPAGLNPFVVYYTPQKLAAAGVSAPPPDWTLEAFVGAAAAVNNPEEDPGSERFAYGFCSSPAFPDIALITYLFGGGLFDSLVQISNPELNQPANVEALAWYGGLRNEQGLIPATRSPRDVGALIYRRSCGFWIDWLDASTFGPESAVGAEMLPLPRHQRAFNIAFQDGYFILAGSEHPEETFQWVTFLMQQESASGSLIPPRRSAVQSPEYAARVGPGVVAVARSLPQDTVILSFDMFQNQRFGQILERFAQAAAQVVYEGADPQAALDAAQEQALKDFR
jgi:ABC-type glycerol-3-phosphate transport system substrate-binding protein